MKNWMYKVQSSPQDVLNKLGTALGSTDGFIFNADKESTSFKIRKPVKYPDQILHRNRLVVNGKVSNASAKNETDVELSFAQDFYMKITVFSIIIFGGILIALISNTSSGFSMYLLGVMVVFIGVVLWRALQRKLERDAQKYKTLISEILGS